MCVMFICSHTARAMNARQPKPSHSAEYKYLFKFILIGCSGVGKSSLLYRYTVGEFLTDYIPTIGVDFRVRTINSGLNEVPVKLQIWDTAGQEKFRTITTGFYRGADAIFLVYDVNDRDSFESIPGWLAEVASNHPNYETVVKYLLGNKADKDASERKVTYEEGANLAAQNGLTFLESSALSGENVARFFEDCAQVLTNKRESSESGAVGGVNEYVQLSKSDLVGNSAGYFGSTGYNCLC